MTKLMAEMITGGLTHTSKMPCPSFSLPASACKTGAKLAVQPGTVCSKCYAMRGNYARFTHVKSKLAQRLELLEHWLEEGPAAWIIAMTELIEPYAYFRWHDSGDVQGKKHLAALVEIARALPLTKFWLPTHEVWVARAAKGEMWPENLVVRLSASKVDGPASRVADLTSTVYRDTAPNGDVCPAPQQGNQCGSCRKCWDPEVKNIAYAFH